ncbi:hypothetical protein CAOG_04665 [Capsaspora owczarzaki ATCC 30864]|uniref:Peptidase C19 ubiquitin carboxyl-terminal hydrolase domain-containing protein n=1 Tax=Capsaspora owczarzaki (strain ATCC 30864) TaxID=595528 RepID=A0A0D2UFP4_CAPO3|nr:hypothetical protein CAOG_04665 [Capsaspora owczarzaki ATCC 30864]KJE93956.1 hypothetical protein CAOG_004665 [Capsaspora owczarzaki ATCC 30864]|eukprot:XP_004347412.1 hypothetical protein CAOG_04665 [Capsaspora owczarzaki ATCC 30864]
MTLLKPSSGRAAHETFSSAPPPPPPAAAAPSPLSDGMVDVELLTVLLLSKHEELALESPLAAKDARLLLAACDWNVDVAADWLQRWNKAARLYVLPSSMETSVGAEQAPSSTWTGLQGISNAGNTCYIDALLFALFARQDTFEGMLQLPIAIPAPPPENSRNPSASSIDAMRKRRQQALSIKGLQQWMVLVINLLRSGGLVGAPFMQELRVRLVSCGFMRDALESQPSASEVAQREHDDHEMALRLQAQESASFSSSSSNSSAFPQSQTHSYEDEKRRMEQRDLEFARSLHQQMNESGAGSVGSTMQQPSAPGVRPSDVPVFHDIVNGANAALRPVQNQNQNQNSLLPTAEHSAPRRSAPVPETMPLTLDTIEWTFERFVAVLAMHARPEFYHDLVAPSSRSASPPSAPHSYSAPASHRPQGADADVEARLAELVVTLEHSNRLVSSGQQDTAELFYFLTDLFNLPQIAIDQVLHHRGVQEPGDERVELQRMVPVAVVDSLSLKSPAEQESQSVGLTTLLDNYLRVEEVFVERSVPRNPDHNPIPPRDRLVNIHDHHDDIDPADGFHAFEATSPFPDLQSQHWVEVTQAPGLGKKMGAFDAEWQHVHQRDIASDDPFESPPVLDPHTTESVPANLHLKFIGGYTTALSQGHRRASQLSTQLSQQPQSPGSILNAMSGATGGGGGNGIVGPGTAHLFSRPIFPVQLKRYWYDRANNCLRKSHRPVQLQTMVDLTTLFAEEKGGNLATRARLVAIVCHRGETSTSGHYVTYAANEYDDWVLFDDTNTPTVVACPELFWSNSSSSSPSTRVHMDRIVRESYLLFYELCTQEESDQHVQTVAAHREQMRQVQLAEERRQQQQHEQQQQLNKIASHDKDHHHDKHRHLLPWHSHSRKHSKERNEVVLEGASSHLSQVERDHQMALQLQEAAYREHDNDHHHCRSQ